MRSFRHLIAIGLLSTASASQAQAAPGSWLVRGFGTLSATRTDDSSNGYVNYPQNISRATKNSWTLASDSVLGIQLDALPDAPLSGTAQVVTRYRAKDRIEPMLEWAFLKYRINESLNVQLGRLITPVQMEAESRFVGFTRTTTRVDLSAYSLSPLSSHNGLSLTYDAMAGDTHWSVTTYLGEGSIELPADSTGKTTYVYRGRNLKGANLSVERDNLTLRVSYTHFNDYVTGGGMDFFKKLLSEAQSASANGCTSCDSIINALNNTFTNMSDQLFDVGFQYSFSPFALWGEFVTNSAKESLRTTFNGFAFGGSVRRGKWTPYVNYGLLLTKEIKVNRISAEDLLQVGPLLQSYSRPGVFPANGGRQTVSLGTRYDFMKNMALKAEATHVRLDDPYRGAPTNAFPKLSPPGEPRAKSFGLYTLALDFVF